MNMTYHGSCHCGAVRFRCQIDLSQTSRCNCSVCTKGRFWKAIAKAADFRLLTGADALADYTFASHNIHHHFCKTCGIKPFGQGEMAELGGVFYAVNVACLDDVSVEELAAATVTYENGRNNNWGEAPAVTVYL